jgi:hypothetical protein
MTATLSGVDYKTLSGILSRWTGINLHAKEVLMSGRLQPRLRALHLAGFPEYVDYLEKSGRAGAEAQRFINALTTNKTSFFRESHHFDFLVKRLFPELRERADSGGGNGCGCGAPAARAGPSRTRSRCWRTSSYRRRRVGTCGSWRPISTPTCWPKPQRQFTTRKRWRRSGPPSAAVRSPASVAATTCRARWRSWSRSRRRT